MFSIGTSVTDMKQPLSCYVFKGTVGRGVCHHRPEKIKENCCKTKLNTHLEGSCCHMITSVMWRGSGILQSHDWKFLSVRRCRRKRKFLQRDKIINFYCNKSPCCPFSKGYWIGSKVSSGKKRWNWLSWVYSIQERPLLSTLLRWVTIWRRISRHLSFHFQYDHESHQGVINP